MTDIHERLSEDHRRLDRLFAELAQAASGSDETAKKAALVEFESVLLAHFEGEERYLFPSLNEVFPEEVVALREEHERIRRTVASLVDENDVASVDEESALRLVDELRRHARREDSMLYKLVNESAGSETYRSLIAYLEQTYRSLRAGEQQPAERASPS